MFMDVVIMKFWLLNQNIVTLGLMSNPAWSLNFPGNLNAASAPSTKLLYIPWLDSPGSHVVHHVSFDPKLSGFFCCAPLVSNSWSHLVLTVSSEFHSHQLLHLAPLLNLITWQRGSILAYLNQLKEISSFFSPSDLFAFERIANVYQQEESNNLFFFFFTEI